MTYLYQILMLYGLTFITAYFAILASGKIKNTTVKALIFGLMLMPLIGLQNHINWTLGWDFLPDSRHFIAACATFFFGLWAFIPIFIAVATFTFLYYPQFLVQSLGILCLVAGVFYIYRLYAHKYIPHLRWYHMIVNAILPMLITIPLSMYLYPGGLGVESAIDNSVAILIVLFVSTYAIFYAVARELERSKNLAIIQLANSDLEAQNLEIRALYEEMAATEEALRENYDALEIYKERLEYHSFHEANTGFLNRNYLFHHLADQDANRGTLVYFKIHEIDHYIDSLGQILCEVLHQFVGKTLSDQLYVLHDSCFVSLSMGRFACLINNFDSDEYNEFFLNTQNSLESTPLVENLTLQVRLHHGAYRIEGHEQVPSLALEYAEIAMLKNSSTDSKQLTWFSADLYHNKQTEARLELDLHRAIRDKQLYLVYQPQVDKNETIIGAEALLRWQHPDLGAISPAVFIPLAEKLGMVNAIGQFVITTVVDVLKICPVPISINTSMIELVDPSFAERLLHQLNQNQIFPGRLHIEITETAMSQRMDNIHANINTLTEFPIDLYLDDFGTGYSSLSHLSRFPISVLKIDKSFVDVFLDSPKMMQVMTGIIDLAHRIHIEVVAEGVETAEQHRALVQLDCDYYQGYYHSKPLSKVDFFELLKMRT